jgi:hypothetical protein
MQVPKGFMFFLWFIPKYVIVYGAEVSDLVCAVVLILYVFVTLCWWMYALSVCWILMSVLVRNIHFTTLKTRNIIWYLIYLYFSKTQYICNYLVCALFYIIIITYSPLKMLVFLFFFCLFCCVLNILKILEILKHKLLKPFHF